MKLLALVLSILTVGFVLLALVSPWFLLVALVTGLILPVLRFAGLVRDQDEMYRYVDYRASHIAYYLMVSIAIITLMLTTLSRHEVSPELTLLILVPLITKFYLQSIPIRNLARTGIYLGSIVGGAWLLFAILSHGFTIEGVIESSIGLSLLLFSLLGLRYRLISASLLIAMGLVATWFVLRSHILTTTKLLVGLFLPLPAFVAGTSLLISKFKEEIP